MAPIFSSEELNSIIDFGHSSGTMGLVMLAALVHTVTRAMQYVVPVPSTLEAHPLVHQVV